MNEEKQYLWYIPVMNDVVVVELRGREFYCVYWGEECFDERYDVGTLVKRKHLEDIAVKVGSL